MKYHRSMTGEEIVRLAQNGTLQVSPTEIEELFDKLEELGYHREVTDHEGASEGLHE